MYKKYHTNLCCITSLTIACNVFHKENNNNNDNILSLVWDLGASHVNYVSALLF